MDVRQAEQRSGVGRQGRPLRLRAAERGPTDGIYGFTTKSDDGTRLLVDGQLVVDNDGEHAPTAASGEIALAKGRHALRLTFFENRGGEELAVQWEGPGFGRQPIPEARLLHAVVKAGAGSGTAGEE